MMQIFPRLMGKAITYILAVMVSLRLGLGLYAWKTANALEQPTYRTLYTLGGGVELREYLRVCRHSNHSAVINP